MHDDIFKLADFGSCSKETLDSEKAAKYQIAEAEELFEKYTTLMYRPPEMIDLTFVTEKSDIWMIGCVLYVICFAKHPFMDAQKLAITNAHYSIPDEEYERIPMKLRDLIRLFLTPSPVKRPDIHQVIKLLGEYEELENIPLNDEAFKIKLKQQEIYDLRNRNRKKVTTKPSPKKNRKNRKVQQPLKEDKPLIDLFDTLEINNEQKADLQTGQASNWADFNMSASQKPAEEAKQTEVKDSSWFDFETVPEKTKTLDDLISDPSPSDESQALPELDWTSTIKFD